MFLVVQIGNGFSQRLDTCSRSVLSPSHGDIDRLRAVEATLDIIVDFGSSLAQIGPLIGTVAEAVLIGTLGAPDYTGRSTGRVKTSVWAVTFMSIAKLTVYL